MNKRASIFYWPLFLVVLLILMGYAMYGVATYQKVEKNTLYVGETQKSLNSLYNEYESNNLFFEEVSKISYYDSLEYLFKNAGKFHFDCGIEEGYVLWKVGVLDCFSTKEEFVDSFEKIFSSKMDIINKDHIKMPFSGNIVFTYGEKNIFFNTKTDFVIIRDKITYQNKLSSNLKESFLIDEYLQIQQEAKNYIKKCKDDIECYRQESKDSYFRWDIKNNGKLFMFDVNTNKKIGLFEKKDLILRFGVNFKDYNPLFG